MVKESVEPHVQSLSTKSVEFYKTSKSTLAPHVIKAQEFVDPYFQVNFYHIHFCFLFYLLCYMQLTTVFLG